MAQLSSPGVSVSVIDESMYTQSPTGTVPLIFVATEENRQNSSGTGIAPGTKKSDYGKVRLLTSQKDLADVFGTPVFKTDAYNNPIHASEQNEYGLQTAYNFLGANNAAFVARADIDLAQLDPSHTPPAGLPENNTFWFDTRNTHFGVFEWNSNTVNILGGQQFKSIAPHVITDKLQVADFANEDFSPNISYPAIPGEYAMVAVSSLITMWYKKSTTYTPVAWVQVGTPEWIASRPFVQGTLAADTIVLNTDPLAGTVDELLINGTPISGLSTASGLVDAINNPTIGNGTVFAAIVKNKIELYSNSTSDVLIAGSTAAKLGIAIGRYRTPVLQMSSHLDAPEFGIGQDTNSSINNRPTGSLWVKSTSPNKGADWNIKIYSSTAASWTVQAAPLFASNEAANAKLDPTVGGMGIPTNSVYIKYNDTQMGYDDVTGVQDTTARADFKIYRRTFGTYLMIMSDAITENTFIPGIQYSFEMQQSVKGQTTLTAPETISFITDDTDTVDDVINKITSAINAIDNSNVVAEKASANKISIKHVTGGEIKFVDLGPDFPIAKLFKVNASNFYAHPNGLEYNYLASMWTSMNDANTGAFAIAGDNVISSLTADNALWYNDNISEVDLLIHNGQSWVGFQYAGDVVSNKHASQYYTPIESLQTDPNGPLVRASKPTLQSDNTPLVTGDIWVDTSDHENYPRIYRYVDSYTKWQELDVTDQTSSNGVLFHDARWAINGQSIESSSIQELLTSNFLDFDAPDPALYPKGMILWNLRRSGNNVKKFAKNYVNMFERNTRYYDEYMGYEGYEYYPHRWVSAAANHETGAGAFGRKAQRKVVVQALQALVNSNQLIRDEETRNFSLIVCPGYPELVNEMVNLNTDRGETAFIIADAPPRLPPDATALLAWGSNEAGALEDGELGLVTGNPYVAYYYPWGYASDNNGNNIAVPPSHMMLYTYAQNDKDAYLWFAPAGMNRGVIKNGVSNVGYVTSEGEFESIQLNEGQRDTLASVQINSITTMAGTAGLVAFSQYTRSSLKSSLDRVNVARLVCFLRRQLLLLGRPYLFEPNDQLTRTQIKRAADQLLLTLSGQRAIYDFITVCDNSNNTAAEIDRSELHLDIAIEPVKAVEFIYIPLRLKNTGEIKGGK
jgi:hypothetical protein